MPDIINTVQNNLEKRVEDVKNTANKQVNIVRGEANQIGEMEPGERVFETINRSASNVVGHVQKFNRNNKKLFSGAKSTIESEVGSYTRR